MEDQSQIIKLNLFEFGSQLETRSKSLTPITSIIINPHYIINFLVQSQPLFQNLTIQSDESTPHQSLQLLFISQIPYLIYQGYDHATVKSLLTISKHVICYYIEPQLQNVVEKKWWDHKSLSHMYHIEKIPTVHFFNSRVKVNKELQNGKLKYYINQEMKNIFKSIQQLEKNQTQPLNLQKSCQLLRNFITNGNFKQNDHFTDRLNFLQLFKLEKNRILKQDIGNMISNNSINSNEIHQKLKGLDLKSRKIFERKIRKLQVFKGIVDKENQKQQFIKTRLKSTETQLVGNQKNLSVKSRWYLNRVEYIQRLIIIVMVIALVQVIFGHNLLTLTVSLIMAIFYLKFID